MTEANFAHRFCNSITSWTHRINPSLAMCTSLLLLSGFIVLGPSVQAQDFNSHTSATSSRIYHTRFKLGPGEGIHEVVIEGAVRFSPDETRIDWIDDDAYVRIVTLEQGQKLQYDAKADGQGHPAVSYKVEGQVRPYDEVAASYLADILPVVFRELAHDQTRRVQIIYDQDGATGVFQMISEIRSDYSVGLHVSAFLGLKDLTDDEINRSYSFIGHHINSDYELASFLYQTTDLYRDRPGVRLAYLDCLNQIQSDIERSRTTQNLFGMETISSDEQPAMTVSSGC